MLGKATGIQHATLEASAVGLCLLSLLRTPKEVCPVSLSLPSFLPFLSQIMSLKSSR